ncbi:unnamed protein product [Heterobilharzia americana]|nr:unnamed protein product [Heterobilharzia americana]
MMEGIWMLLKVWFKIDLRDYNDWLCIFHTSLSNYFLYFSAYMQSILSIQRCYVVLRPLRVKSKSLSLSRLLIYQGVISSLLILPILPYPLYWRVIDGDCDPVNEKLFRLTTLCDLLIWGFIPVFVMTTCTGIIFRNLFIRHKFVKSTFQKNIKMSNNQSSWSYTSTSTSNLCKHSYQSEYASHMKTLSHSENLLLCQETVFNSSDHRTSFINDIRLPPDVNQRRYISQDSNTRITPLLICMNLVYMASVCPLLIYFLCLNFIFKSIDSDTHRFFYYLFRSFCLLNTCTNWIFYCVAGKMFRDKTKQLLISLCHTRKNSTHIDENGYLIIRYNNKSRCSISNVTRISTKLSQSIN